MENSNISLCVTYPRLNDPDKSIKFRVADKVGNRLEKVTYNYVDREVRNIFSKPNDTIPYHVELVKWWFDPIDQEKTRSEVYEDESIYEIFIDYYYLDRWRGNYDKVTQDLKRGIQLYEGLSDYFFIIIGKTVSYYKAVLCNKKDLHNGIYRMSIHGDNIYDTTSVLAVYNIPQSCVIETRDLNIRTVEDEVVDRLFYSELELPLKTDDIVVFSVQDYAPYLFKKYMKKYKNKFDFTNNQIKNIVYMINEFIKDKNELLSVSELTGMNEEQILDQLRLLEIDLGGYLETDNEIEQIIQNGVKKNDKYVKMMRESIRAEFIASKTDEIEEYNKKILELEKKYTTKSDDINEAEKLIGALKTELNSINSEMNDKEVKVINYEKDIKKILKNYKDESLKIFSSLEILKYMENKEEMVTIDDIIIQRREAVEEVTQEIDDIDAYIEDLSHNLECIGIQKDYCNDLAIYILILMKLSIPLIVPDIIAKNLANAVAYITDNKNSMEIIFNAENLKHTDVMKISEYDEKVIFVNHRVEDISENNLLSITAIKNKLIVIPYKDRTVVRILSDAVFDYFTLLDLDNLMDLESDEKFYSGRALDEMFNSIASSHHKSRKYFQEYSSKVQSEKIRKSNLIKHSRIKDLFKTIKGKEYDSEILINELRLIDNDITFNVGES